MALTFQCLNSLENVSPTQWDALDESKFPFSSFAFLRALETTQCVGKGSGWLPRYLIAEKDGALIGALSLFVKDHSYGEYIFDWNWAHAYETTGRSYYPKLISMTPFTPATGRKLRVRSGESDSIIQKLLAEAQNLAERERCHSIHYLFLTPEETEHFDSNQYLMRETFQFHWHNRSYGHFNDFMDDLKSRKRKQIVKERQALKSYPIRIEQLSGDQLSVEHASLFFSFYLNTVQRMGAIAYLNQDFFEEIFSTMADKILLFLAFDGSKPLAGALHFLGEDTLFGRYWGCALDIPNLHFELCYYRAIEYAINNQLKKVEAGAQGPHKIQRGFLPTKTFSTHFILDKAFKAALEKTVHRERIHTEAVLASEDHLSPYKERPND